MSVTLVFTQVLMLKETSKIVLSIFRIKSLTWVQKKCLISKSDYILNFVLTKNFVLHEHQKLQGKIVFSLSCLLDLSLYN